MKEKQPPNLHCQGKTVIACPIFTRELQTVLDSLNIDPIIHYMHYAIHSDPALMETELLTGIDSVYQKENEICFLVGKNCDCVHDIETIVTGCHGRIVEAANCIEALLGKEAAQELQKNRTTLMTPAWIEMINNSIKDDRWTVTDARINLGMFDRIVILDFGIEPIDDEMLMEFFDLTQVPVETLAADLDYFKEVIVHLLGC